MAGSAKDVLTGEHRTSVCSCTPGEANAVAPVCPKQAHLKVRLLTHTHTYLPAQRDSVVCNLCVVPSSKRYDDCDGVSRRLELLARLKRQCLMLALYGMKLMQACLHSAYVQTHERSPALTSPSPCRICPHSYLCTNAAQTGQDRGFAEYVQV